MNELATFIGWVVIVVGGLFALSRILSGLNEPARREEEAKRRATEERLYVTKLVHVISLNRIYWKCRNDKHLERIKEFANYNLGGWAVLQDSEEALSNFFESLGQGEKYRLASKIIADHGEPLEFSGGTVIIRISRADIGDFF